MPEHVAEISIAFIAQQILARLASRDFRILSAIFKQTIGYNKREDDMNSACLEMLTNIRGDHASESVRRLTALNVILTRRGRYGKWMSINFDFKNWGKAPCESTTNDPSCLLSAAYQTLYEEDLYEFKLHTLPESRKKELVVEVIKEEQNTVLAPLPAEPAPVAVIKEEEKTVLTPLDLPSKPTPSAMKKPKSDAFKLDFSDSIPEKLRQLIIKHLGNLHLSKKTQPLLDYFAERLNNGKIRNPIAYFINLKDRWLNGTLELYQTVNQPQPNQQSPLEPDKKAQQQKIQNSMAYQHAFADVEHIKKLIKVIMDQTKTTFEGALKEINYTQIWAKSVENLEQAKKACMQDCRTAKAMNESDAIGAT